jgi:hypothetical protein
MGKLFTVGEELLHVIGDATCPECLERYPEPCPCGGLIHAAAGDEDESDGDAEAMTRCDLCGRSEEERG